MTEKIEFGLLSPREAFSLLGLTAAGNNLCCVNF